MRKRRQQRTIKALSIILIVMIAVLMSFIVCFACSPCDNEKGTFQAISKVTTKCTTESVESLKQTFISLERPCFETTSEENDEIEVEEVDIEDLEQIIPESSSEEVLENQDALVRPEYSISGHVLDRNIQSYLYDKLNENGIAWWFETALIQAYQECSWDYNQVTTHSGELNNDCGLFQFKERWWSWYQAEAGFSGLDIMNPYNQIDVYVFHINRWIQRGYERGRVLSNWYNGCDEWNETYVRDVTSWEGRLERIE